MEMKKVDAGAVTGHRGAAAITAALMLLAGVGCSSSGSDAQRAPISCADLTSLRDLGSSLSLVKNPHTGNTLEYIVIGDGADSDELIAFFPGTGGSSRTGRRR
jgi:hypothetical protein